MGSVIFGCFLVFLKVEKYTDLRRVHMRLTVKRHDSKYIKEQENTHEKKLLGS
jgi:hypothetical protein